MKRAVGLTGTVVLAFGLLVGPALAQTPYTAGLTIEKEVIEEDEGEEFAEVEFHFELRCDDEDDYEQDFSLVHGQSVNFGDVPGGAECTLTEDVPQELVDHEDLTEDDFLTLFFLSDEDLVTDGDERSITFLVPHDEDVAIFIDVLNVFGEVEVEEIVVERVVEVEEVVVEEEVEEEVEDDVAVLAVTGFEVTWGLLLGTALLLSGGGAVLYARKRESAKI